MTRSRTAALRAGLLAAPLLVLLGACGGGSTSTTDATDPAGRDGSTSTGPEVVAPAPETGLTTQDAGARSGGSTSTKAAVAPISRAVISSGQVSLHADSLLEARAEILRLTSSWNGQVADEQTSSGDGGRIVESTITLRVPSAKFAQAMDALGTLGEVDQTSRSSEDVTTQVIDNGARVRAAERSIQQIERLLSKATQLSDIIAIESDLARRQADLDSLRQQQAYLADQTSLSTIDVHLSRTAPPPAATKTTGFLAGLSDGWHALTASTMVLLQALGALLPFALLGLVLGVPLWLVVRRHRPTTTPTVTEA